jgi:hypothetical protein
MTQEGADFDQQLVENILEWGEANHIPLHYDPDPQTSGQKFIYNCGTHQKLADLYFNLQRGGYEPNITFSVHAGDIYYTPKDERFSETIIGCSFVTPQSNLPPVVQHTLDELLGLLQ